MGVVIATPQNWYNYMSFIYISVVSKALYVAMATIDFFYVLDDINFFCLINQLQLFGDVTR